MQIVVAGYREGDTKLGHAAEAIAEGWAFEEEGKLKQAFFSYYAGLDSFIEAERIKLNRGSVEEDQIGAEIRMVEKLRDVVRRNLPGNSGGLNKVKIWGDVVKRFNMITETRNAIAHNTKIAAITQIDVDVCFSTLAIIIAIVHDQCLDEASILECYGVSG
ncbi:hypothetical protein CN198_27035 [Sinorhizobium meliloti]|uniref:hypothetical protein n=1 Tax=Rhizobium meliloti TaxID=382 RepID=UPI000FD6DF02|nr:hypothetical protein [Sinorhizobium meliloti]RVH62714.1 hypothetical protein CN198_27035 [Sinorhizobium meliloti]RVK62854.1 hypothetical protein CN159_30305 [Sinorhizobium meliloti]